MQFHKRFSPAEMLQHLHIQRLKLEKHTEKTREQMTAARENAKVHLRKGDETGFRLASRKYFMIRNTHSAVHDLKEMAEGMIDLVEMGVVLRDVIATGGDLAKLQSKLGLDPLKLESSLAKIKTSLSHMEGIADTLSMTIESTLPSAKELSVDQVAFRKELIVEIQADKTDEEKLKEKITMELEQAKK